MMMIMTEKHVFEHVASFLQLTERLFKIDYTFIWCCL